jgi:glucose-6-phosphate 1-dehydrogenase
VGGRAGYYDQAGHLRDMVQNHLTQLVTLCAMEPPARFDADAIRAEKVKVLHAIEPIDPADVVLGQYVEGAMPDDGANVPAYTEEEDVPDGSTTETFAALKLRVANWRWQGTPFYLRTGKRMPRRTTQIAVHFRCAPVSLFRTDGAPEGCGVDPNVLLITLQPDEGFDLRFEVKAPDVDVERTGMNLVTQTLSFSYEDAFGPVPDAYQTLLRDIITGDQTLFVRADEVEASWDLYTPLLKRKGDLPLHPYAAGTWGPEAAFDLGAAWTSPDLAPTPAPHTTPVAEAR